MAVTILEALQNSLYNLNQASRMPALFIPLASEQLRNAVGLLERGYPLSTEVEPLLERYDSVDDVPTFEPHPLQTDLNRLLDGRWIEANEPEEGSAV